MPTAPAMKQMFERLDYTPEAATALVDEQGISDVEDIADLSSEQVDKLISVVRKPGGGQDGHVVSFTAQTLFHSLVYYVQHRRRTSRPIDVGVIDKTTVRALRFQQDMEKNWPSDTTTVDDVKVNFKNMPKTMELVMDVIRKKRGVTGARLDYVLRKELRPKTSASDPSTNYATIDEEVVARHPIVTSGAPADDSVAEAQGPFDQHFVVDSQAVYDILFSIFGNTEAWTYSKDFRKGKWGRKLWMKLQSHYLGANMIDHMAAGMEATLRALTYRKATKNFNWNKFCAAHVEQHNIAKGLIEYGYPGLAEQAKFRYLLDGVLHEGCQTVKTTILASPELRSDFDACVNLFSDFLRNEEATHVTSNRNISTVTTGGGKGGNGGRGGDDTRKPTRAQIDACTHIQDKYYSKKEYAKFTAAEKARHYELRSARLGNKSPNKKRNADLAALDSRVAALELNGKGGNLEEDDSEEDQTGNRKNKALTRQKQK